VCESESDEDEEGAAGLRVVFSVGVCATGCMLAVCGLRGWSARTGTLVDGTCSSRLGVVASWASLALAMNGEGTDEAAAFAGDGRLVMDVEDVDAAATGDDVSAVP
jgi:hypothetical protein